MSDEETKARVEYLTERVMVLSAVVVELLSDREEQAMVKAATIFKDPREKAVDIVGFTVRPWLMVATPADAKAVRALPLDAVVRDIGSTCSAPEKGAAMAAKVREHAITWDEIGVAPDGLVRADSMAKMPGFLRGKAAR